MKKLKAVAISDLHLGEPECMLYHKDTKFNLIKTTVTKIAELSQGDSNFEDGVEELILIGDIIELSEAMPYEAYENARPFFNALLNKVNIEKIVYIPGNHDHHFWVTLLMEHCNKKKYKECKPKTCQFIVEPQLFTTNCLPLGYPSMKVEVHYPYYVLNSNKSFYFFDHGHLFSKTLERFTAAIDAKDIEGLEECTYSFMEKIWYRGKNPLKVAWFKVRERLYDWWREKGYEWKEAGRGTRFKEDCAPVYDDYIRNKILWYLTEICKIQEKYEDAFSKDFHFVFGHTHCGGRILKVDRKFRIKGKFITVWNTGGWLVPSQVFSPDTYIFYIENKEDKGIRADSYKLASKKYTTWEGDYYRKILYEVYMRIGKEELVKEDIAKDEDPKAKALF